MDRTEQDKKEIRRQRQQALLLKIMNGASDIIRACLDFEREDDSIGDQDQQMDGIPASEMLEHSNDDLTGLSPADRVAAIAGADVIDWSFLSPTSPSVSTLSHNSMDYQFSASTPLSSIKNGDAERNRGTGGPVSSSNPPKSLSRTATFSKPPGTSTNFGAAAYTSTEPIPGPSRLANLFTRRMENVVNGDENPDIVVVYQKLKKDGQGSSDNVEPIDLAVGHSENIEHVQQIVAPAGADESNNENHNGNSNSASAHEINTVDIIHEDSQSSGSVGVQDDVSEMDYKVQYFEHLLLDVGKNKKEILNLLFKRSFDDDDD